MSGQTITDEQQFDLLSKFVDGQWVSVLEDEDQLIMDGLETNGWRFDFNGNGGDLKYRLVWRQRLIGRRLLRKLTKEEAWLKA